MSDSLNDLLVKRVAQLEADRRRELWTMTIVIGGVFLVLTVVIGIAWETGHLRAPATSPTVTVTTTAPAASR